MSFFASLTTKTVTFPPPQAGAQPITVTIKRLSGPDQERAQAAHMKGVFDGFGGRGWANSFGRKLLAGTASETEAKSVANDPLAGYDRFMVVRQGITDWSFTETVEEGGRKVTRPKPITDKTIDDIDDEPMETLAIEIMKLTKPSLFKTAEELETERKNG